MSSCNKHEHFFFHQKRENNILKLISISLVHSGSLRTRWHKSFENISPSKPLIICIIGIRKIIPVYLRPSRIQHYIRARLNFAQPGNRGFTDKRTRLWRKIEYSVACKRMIPRRRVPRGTKLWLMYASSLYLRSCNFQVVDLRSFCTAHFNFIISYFIISAACVLANFSIIPIVVARAAEQTSKMMSTLDGKLYT